MSSGAFRISLFVCAAALLFASAASGASILTPYNAIVSGNFSDGCCDINGGLAVGGNLTLNAYMSVTNTLNGEAVTDFPHSATLVVAGTETGPAQLYNGYYYVGSGTVNCAGCSGALPSSIGDPINFTTVFSTFAAESTQISKETATSGSSAALSGTTLTITVGKTGLNIVNVTQAQVQGANKIVFQAGTGVTFATSTSSYGNAYVLLNIAGTSDTFSPASGTDFCTSSGTCTQQVGDSAYGAEDVLYNFYQASAVTFSCSIVGSILAPNAAITDTSGQQIDGSLVAASFTGSAQFHNLNFLGPTFTPEPASIACVGLGLLGLAYFLKRRRA